MVVLLLALAPLAAGCSSGKKPPTAATSAPTTTQVVRPLTLDLTVTSRGPQRGFDARKAARQASPGLQKFLDHYLTVAFLQPSQAKSGWRGLLVMFDRPVRATASKQIDSLSLGSAAAQVTAVRPGPARASAVVLFDGGRPAAATVKLSFDGTADSPQGSGPVRLRAALHLLGVRSGWLIAGYKSAAGGGS